jgi:hypothetical protein
MSHHRSYRRRDPLVWGLILIAIGLVFLLQNVLNIEVWDHIWKFWPLLLILWGAQKILDGLRKPKDQDGPPPAPQS